jgi:hypothetical protein
MTCYGACVLMVNLILLKMTNNYTGWNEIILFLQTITFWVTVRIQNEDPVFTVLYGNWPEFVASAAAWLGMILAVLFVFTIDIVLRNIFGSLR